MEGKIKGNETRKEKNTVC